MASILLEIVPLIAILIFGKVIVDIIKVSKSGLKPKLVQEKLNALEDDLSAMEQELEDSRSRIEVLEKIITDDKSGLRDEIDGLSRAQ